MEQLEVMLTVHPCQFLFLLFLTVYVSWSVEECEEVADTLLEIAKGEREDLHMPYDIIGLSSHGYNGLERWLRGSMSMNLLAHTTLPLLMVHPQSKMFASASPAGISTDREHSPQPAPSF